MVKSTKTESKVLKKSVAADGNGSKIDTDSNNNSEVIAVVDATVPNTVVVDTIIPDGRPKSGRLWKVKQTFRSSAQDRRGVNKHLCKSFEQREIEKIKRNNVLALEREMKAETKNKKNEEKERREERQRQRQANEYKNSVYQEIKPEKMKSMSKKQLRNIKKTSVTSTGQVTLVDAYSGQSGMKKILQQKR